MIPRPLPQAVDCGATPTDLRRSTNSHPVCYGAKGTEVPHVIRELESFVCPSPTRDMGLFSQMHSKFGHKRGLTAVKFVPWQATAIGRSVSCAPAWAGWSTETAYWRSECTE